MDALNIQTDCDGGIFANTQIDVSGTLLSKDGGLTWFTGGDIKHPKGKNGLLHVQALICSFVDTPTLSSAHECKCSGAQAHLGSK